ncbi:hypothetical protein PRUPE_5G002500 [Prunus persica]|uniref:Uncharacterized protein n=1 Tax=Prunus persica TaxID=3760 RepID=M5WDI8_PRUPE|nr:hypothetical protein PRUPE_5G002500 [Prunus persica]
MEVLHGKLRDRKQHTLFKAPKKQKRKGKFLKHEQALVPCGHHRNDLKSLFRLKTYLFDDGHRHTQLAP